MQRLINHTDTTFGSGNPQPAAAGSWGSILEQCCSVLFCFKAVIWPLLRGRTLGRSSVGWLGATSFFSFSSFYVLLLCSSSRAAGIPWLAVGISKGFAALSARESPVFELCCWTSKLRVKALANLSWRLLSVCTGWANAWIHIAANTRCLLSEFIAILSLEWFSSFSTFPKMCLPG